MIFPAPPAEVANQNSNREGVEEDVWTTSNPLAKGYLINWLLFTPPEEDETRSEMKIENLKQSDAVQVDASRPIPMPLSPAETLQLRDQVHQDNLSKEIIKQDPAEPGVYHARIFISSSIELQYLKELMIPYSPFPYFKEPSLNYNPAASDMVGYTDFSEYKEGAFFYVIMSGYHYNFLIQNGIFQAVQNIRKLEYDELAMINFNLSLSPTELDRYTDQLNMDANELKKRDPDSHAKLERFHSLQSNYQFAIFGILANGLTRIFANVWNVVRAAVIRATAHVISHINFDPARLNIPQSLRDRMKFKPEDFIRNAFTPPKWLQDRLKPPKWLTDRLGLTDHKPLRGIIEILDGNGGVLNFKRKDRKMTLDFTPITLLGPSLAGITPLREGTSTYMNGYFDTTVMNKALGLFISYDVCFTLDNSYSFVTNNGILPVSVCNGAFSPREIPHYIQVKNVYALTSAMTQYAHVEAIHKLGIVTKKARIFQGGASLAEWPKPGGRFGAFAPCGQIRNLHPSHQQVFLHSLGLLGELLDYDIYLQKTENFLTVVHEYSHIVHCSLIGDNKYKEQIQAYANDIVSGQEPRNGEFGALHEGVANYFEFIINAAMDYCKGCKNIEENIHTGYVSGFHLSESTALGPETDYNIFGGQNLIRYYKTILFNDDHSTFSSNRVAAVASFLYDLEDSCQDNFLDVVNFSDNVYDFDRVAMGRSAVINSIATLPYPAKVRDLNAQAYARGVSVADYLELVNMHGLNHLSAGLKSDVNLTPGLYWFELDSYNIRLRPYFDCLDQTENTIHQNLASASNIRSLGITSSYRTERTSVMEIDKSKSLSSVMQQVIPQGAIAPSWKKEGGDSQEVPNWISLGANLYSTNPITWTSEFGITLQEFMEESVPMNSTSVTWAPIGKENKNMGYTSYTQVENYISPEIEHYFFTSLVPEYAANNVNFYPEFQDQISPEGCQNRNWIPIGKQPQVMGLECWTAVGYWGVPIYEDHCTPEPIEIDQRGNVQKHPVHINDHFKHLYDVRKGKLSCDFHIPSYSDLMEVDQYAGFGLPGGAYGKVWNHLYYQKDGKIQFSNSGDNTSFITRSGNTEANLTSQKEKGYFEYLIENL
ncbi:hypothetical protein [Leptospira kobayashii]|nr:hypothetical protein [Leptospira kobayashii]